MRKAVLFAMLVPALAYAGGKASAFRPENKMGTNYWNAQSAIDGKPETAWMVPGESDNRGEWIEIDVPRGDVDKIAILPGFAKSDDTFGDYPRIKQVRVDISSVEDDQSLKVVNTATLTLTDKNEVQILDLPDSKVGNEFYGGKVKISIMDFYPGNDYPNIAVSEIAVIMKEFEAFTKITAASGELPGHGNAMAGDGDVKTNWQVMAPATLTLDGVGYGLSSLGFQGAGKDLSRPKTIEVTIAGRTTKLVVPDSVTGMQWVPLPAFNGYTGGAFGAVDISILDTYPGTKPEIGISEIKVKATNREDF